MPITVESKIEGLGVLEKRLKALGADVGGRALKSSLNASLTPALKEARARAPRGDNWHETAGGLPLAPGFLSRSIKKRSWKSKSGRYAVAAISVLKEAYYGLQFLHQGTKYIDKNEWLADAFESKQTEVLNKFKSDLKRKIDKAARK